MAFSIELSKKTKMVKPSALHSDSNVGDNARAKLSARSNSSTTGTQNQTKPYTKIKSYGWGDGSILSVAQELKSDLVGLDTMEQSIERGLGTINVALGAVSTVSDLLLEAKELSTMAGQNTDQYESCVTYDAQFQNIISQIDEVVSTAQYNEINLLDGNSPSVEIVVNPNTGESLTLDNYNLRPGEQIISVTHAPTHQLRPTDTHSAAENIKDVTDALNFSIANVNDVMVNYSRMANELEQSRILTDRLYDVIEAGIENLTGTEHRDETSRLKALELAQTANARPLSLISRAPRQILSLLED